MPRVRSCAGSPRSVPLRSWARLHAFCRQSATSYRSNRQVPAMDGPGVTAWTNPRADLAELRHGGYGVEQRPPWCACREVLRGMSDGRELLTSQRPGFPKATVDGVLRTAA